jgi:hypothetical protein
LTNLGEKHGLYKEVIETNKKILFGEYHKNIVDTYGFNQAGAKLANILSVINNIMVNQAA